MVTVDGRETPKRGWRVHPKGNRRCWCSQDLTERCCVCRKYYTFLENPNSSKDPKTSCKKKPNELKKRRRSKKQKMLSNDEELNRASYVSSEPDNRISNNSISDDVSILLDNADSSSDDVSSN